MHPDAGIRPESIGRARRRLDRVILGSRVAIFWEQLWPVLVPLLIVAGFYVGLSWIGVWPLLPTWARIVALVCIIGAFIYLLLPLRRLRWPSRAEGLRRVEIQSGHSHRPLVAIEDDLSAGSNDPFARAMWEAHRRRMSAALSNLKAGLPQPGAFRSDPYALRVAAAMLVVVGFTVAGEDRWRRLVDLFPDRTAEAEVPTRIDAWVTPPAYTGRPPVFLTGTTGTVRDPSRAIRVPEGSEFVVRSQGSSSVRVVLTTEEGTADVTPAAETTGPSPIDRRSVLKSSSRAEVFDGDTVAASWLFDVEPDAKPTIRLLNDPEEQYSGSLKFNYLVQDDYGIVSAEALIQPISDPNEPPGERRPLVEAPRFPLALPAGERKSGAAETIRDLTNHPWAGSEVELVLVARDHAGHEGRSEPHRLTLPQRAFAKPLARAIVEQRRELALDARQQDRVIMAFDALMLAPDKFMDSAKTYLDMDFAYHRLVEAQDDATLRELLPLLWDLALTIEDGDLSVAERALRDAQEALRKALENGASDEEIARLADELRKALNEYFQALAEQMRQNPQAMQPVDPNAQSLRPQDLDEMLRRIEELAKSGSRDAARELLAQMQRMLENPQAGRPQMAPDGATREMMQALNELGRMIQRQQELMDQTHRYDQNGRQGQPQQGQQGQQQGQNGQMTPEQLAEALRQLQQGQGDLAQQLQELMDQLSKNGMPQNGDLGEAGESMGKAGEALGEGQTGEAVGEQGNALEALRRGAQGMAEQMLSQGEGQRPGMARSRSPLDEDPLGRPRRTEGPDFGEQVKVPDEIDVQRARRILEELRRRFSDPSRPMLELDYLERLLRHY